MTAHPNPGRRLSTRALVAAGAVVGLILLLLYLQGTLSGGKVAPGVVDVPMRPTPRQLVVVESRTVSDVVAWPATVRSRTLANVAPKVMARVLEMRVAAGTAVHAGDIVAVLDDRDIKARADQTRAAVHAAEAEAAQANADRARVQRLFTQQAATQQTLDAITARAKSTAAQVAQARNALAESEALLADTSLRAPFDGLVAARFADPGDMAVPGKPLVVVYDPGALRLEASVGERCARALRLGMDVRAHLDAPARDLVARIDEIAPAADPQTRTLLIKAALPIGPDVRPGTYADVQIECGSHTALLIPAAAVVRTGQLESVRLAADGQIRVRNVRVGKTYGDAIEIVSGLAAGDRVVLD